MDTADLLNPLTFETESSKGSDLGVASSDLVRGKKNGVRNSQTFNLLKKTQKCSCPKYRQICALSQQPFLKVGWHATHYYMDGESGH